MPIIGLTGGIATGKSTVSAMLAALGAVIVDADRVARAVVKKGTPAWQRIKARFGDGILAPDGEIDREALGRIVFHDPGQKAVLERITHPAVFAEMAARMEAILKDDPNAVIVLDVPLLIESGMRHPELNAVIVVYVPEAVQRERLMARDRISAADAMARIRSQMPIEEKKARAGIVIDNTGSVENTRRQVIEAFQKLTVNS